MSEEIKNTVLNASVAPENFDWDAFENEGVDKSSKEETLAKYEQTLSKVTENEVVEGVVTSINKREVVVNIGAKSEGVISAPEFRYNPDLKVGDKVEVLVESAEDRKGQLVISHKKARQLKSWDMVNAAYESGEVVKGYVKTRTKGGMIVDVFGIEAFLPGSQIDIKPIRDYDVFVDTTMDFKIVKINQEFRNVVVSHKALLEAEQELKRAELISKLEKGQVLEGVVKNITNYGVFVDLGGVDGLIHITDLSWGRISHPEEVVALDQKINVVVLDFNEQQKRIALGLKQLTPHPWEALSADLKVGDTVKGKGRGRTRRGRPGTRERNELEPPSAQRSGIPEDGRRSRGRYPHPGPRGPQDVPGHQAAHHQPLGEHPREISCRFPAQGYRP